MKIHLDHIQRLNLHALLGTQRGDVATIRAIWTLQDKIALNPEEEDAIELKREFVAGSERAIWNPALPLSPKEIDLEDAEIVRIRMTLETWSSFSAAADRRWLELLLRDLTSEVPQGAYPGT